MSFLSVSHDALLTRGRRSANGSKRLINEESMECSNILVSSSQSHHSTSHHSALLATGSNGCSPGQSYGVKESTECDVMASDIDSGSSRSRSDSSSGSASLSISSTPGTKDRVWMVALCTFIACLTSLLNGMMLGFSSPALTQLQFNVSEEYRISHNDVKFSLFAVSIIIL